MFSIETQAGQTRLEYLPVTSREQQRLRDILGVTFQISPVGILITTPADGRVVEVNDACLALTGYARDEVIGHATLDLGLWTDAFQRATFISSIPPQGVLRNLEHRFPAKDGQLHVALLNAEHLQVGTDTYLLVMIQDITERKRAEETQTWLASFPELNPNPIIEADLAGQLHYLNPAVRQLLPELETLGLQHPWLSDLLVIGQRLKDGVLHSLIREVPLGAATYQQAFYYVTGTQRVRIYALDISQRKRAMQELVKIKEQLEVTLDSITEGYYALDAEWRFIAANRRAEEHFKRPIEELLGRNIWEMTGTPFDSELYRHFQLARVEQRPIHFEAASRMQTDYWGELHLYPREDRLDVYFRDISQRRQAEAALKARNDDLNAFAHTVAHDLKNPLNVALGYTALFEQDFAESNDPRQASMAQASRSMRRMDRIIDDLLLLAGVSQAKVECVPLDMAAIVAESLNRLADLVDTYHPEIILPDTWPVAFGYAPWIEEVWLNYLSNAFKYGGRPPRVVLGSDRQPDGTLRFWVRDNGEGISLQAQAHLFRAFNATTKLRGTGHGVGLSIVRRIVEKLGGQVAAENNSGEPGSTFSFTLPGAPVSDEG